MLVLVQYRTESNGLWKKKTLVVVLAPSLSLVLLCGPHFPHA